MRFLPVLAVALFVLLVGCAAPAPAPAPAPATATATAEPAPTPSAAPPTPAGPAPATSWVMPDLVGANLQDAQDAIQSLTDFGIPITTSTDATGEGRFQVVDRNWVVCDQNVAPGETITAGSAIDFSVVQNDESC